MNMLKFTELEADLEEQANIAYFFFDWVMNTMLSPGHVESWLIIMDYDGIALKDLPVKKLQSFVGAMQRNFRGRMFRNIVLNTHWVLQGLWNMVWGWLDPFVQQKITVCKAADMKSTLTQYVDESVLEEKYGGTRPNITSNYFPPKY